MLRPHATLSRWFKILARQLNNPAPRKHNRQAKAYAAAFGQIDILEDRTLLSAGTLDPDFGDGGKVLTNVGGLDFAEGIAFQSDGKIIVAGYSQNNPTTGTDFAIVRYNSNGTIDTSFGIGGKTLIDFKQQRDLAFNVVVDSQDRIIVGGQIILTNGQSFEDAEFAVARLTSEGNLDTTFDTDGRLTISFRNSFDFGYDVAVDSLDRIVIAGHSQPDNGFGAQLSLVRVTETGVVDDTFGNGGIATQDGVTAPSIVLDEQDSIVVAYANVGGFGVSRFTSGGDLDSQFGDQGRQHIDFGLAGARPFDLTIDSLGRIVVAGTRAHSSGNEDFAVSRLTNNGQLDTTFDQDGRQIIDFGNRDFGNAVAVDAEDRVIVAGWVEQPHPEHSFLIRVFGVTRLSSFGVIDQSFGNMGRQTVDFGTFASDEAYAVAVDAQERIVVAGTSRQDGTSTGWEFAIARLLGDPLNTRPTANAGGPYSGLAGQNIFLDASSSVDPDQPTNTLRFDWDLSYDGETFQAHVTDSQTVLASFTQTATVAVRVTDSEGESDIATATVTILNTPPSINAGGDLVVEEGSAIASSGSFTDPDSDVWTATVDYGDGAGPQALALACKTFVLEHVYADNGVYTITVTVDDGGGAILSDIVFVTVINVPPTVNAGANAAVNEGSAFIGSGSFSDPGTDAPALGSSETWVATVNYGDGSGSQPLVLNGNKTFQLNHTYLDNGTYAVTVTINDDDGGEGSDTLLVTVNNVPPQNVTISGTSVGVRGQTLAFGSSFNDPGSDTHTYAWSVQKDGSSFLLPPGTPVNSASFSFVPTEAGNYSVNLTVTDDDGGTGSDTHALAVGITGLQDDPLNPGQSVLIVGGSVTNDRFHIGSGANTGEVSVNIDNQSFGSFTPGRIVIYAQDGDNDIVVSSSVTTDVWIFGGSGNDRIKGGSGNDVLIGGGGDDILMGNAGRDLLIGGLGADRIIGNKDDDILIAALTAYDNNLHALAAIMAEWTSARTFADRVDNIRQGSGELAGSGFQLDGNVTDDNSEDVLTGSQGDDWFIWSLDDRATDLNDIAFEGDLDWILGL